MPGKQLLLHREAHPGSGLPHIRLDLTHVLDVSVHGKDLGLGEGHFPSKWMWKETLVLRLLLLPVYHDTN